MRIEENRINVIFDAGRGRLSVESREAVVGHPFGVLPKPTRSGYGFQGWYWNGERVTEETVIESEEDITLVARWSKRSAQQRKPSMLKKQKLAVLVLAVACVVLIGALLITNHVVAIYPLEDVYYSDEGEKFTEKYYVKKKNGQYGLYDKSGALMEYNEERGYFTAHSGNQYIVDLKTGAYSLHAVVDFDAESGELLSMGNRVMIFPEINSETVYSIEVTNKNDSYTYRFYRDEKGNIKIAGAEELSATYDPYKFSYLCISCGYTSTTMKLDFVSKDSTAPRLEDGSIDYSAYGLADVYDAEGNLIYTPTVYTITKSALDKKGEVILPATPATKEVDTDGDGTADSTEVIQYTVKVGDPILSGAGYYVQLEGRDAVYIVDAGLGETALKPIEALLTPQITHPLSATTHAMVQNFLLGKTDLQGNLENLESVEIDSIVEFSFQDIKSRMNTLFSARPYVTPMDFMSGYEINDESVSEMLGLFYDMEFVACKQLGITADSLKEYGLDGEVYYITFDSPVMGKDEKGNNIIIGYATNTMLVGDKTEQGTYYVASFEYGMIVEVDQHYFSFLEWENNRWYANRFFNTKIDYVTELHVRVGDDVYNFTLDNSKTEQNDVVNSGNIEIYCDRYQKGKDHPNKLDYETFYTYVNDKGMEKTASITGVNNFRKLYITLLEYTIMGDFDEFEFKQNMNGVGVEEFLKDANTVPDAEISFHAKDYASTMNDYTYEDEDGNTVKLYTKDNEQDIVYRFYRYSAGKALLTLEVVKDTDGDGVLDPNAANAQYAFYVKSSYFGDILSEIGLLLAEQPIVPET